MSKEQAVLKSVLKGLDEPDLWVVHKYTWAEDILRKMLFRFEKLGLVCKCQVYMKDHIGFKPTEKALNTFKELKTNKERLDKYKELKLKYVNLK